MEDNFSLKKFVKNIEDDAKKFASKHHINFLHLKKKGTVLVPKKVGRENPEFIVTDHFNLAKIVDTVNTIGSAVEKVGNAAEKVTAAISTVNNTVKATVVTPPSNTGILANAGYLRPTGTNPYVNNGYSPNTPVTGQQPLVVQPEMSLNSQTMLLVGGGIIVLVIITLLLRK